MTEKERAEFLIEFGNRVKTLRIKREMTLEELAKKIGYTTENARSSVQKIEAGKSDPPASRIHNLANALEVPVAVLMGWEEMDVNHDTEQIQSEIEIAELIQNQYGKDTLQIFSEFLALEPGERERITKLLSGYSKLDKEDRMIIVGRIFQIIEDMLAADKYTIQKELRNA